MNLFNSKGYQKNVGIINYQLLIALLVKRSIWDVIVFLKDMDEVQGFKTIEAPLQSIHPALQQRTTQSQNLRKNHHKKFAFRYVSKNSMLISIVSVVFTTF